MAMDRQDYRPANVGILAADVYFPSTYVAQADLEVANGVAAGKYTVGLGQEAMAFTGDREDINSICLSVVAQLLEKYDIPRGSIGRIEVGTETLIDKSKSTKTVLMSLFEEAGNTDIEGATTMNACYGGTAALLNAVAWVESSGWDGKYAIVVAADIAVYAEGPARPTGGCGAVAVLVGPDAPLVVNMKTRTSHACNVWDFFKPDMSSEYPTVNGQLSQACYLRALDDCYNRLARKKFSAMMKAEAMEVSGKGVVGECTGPGAATPFTMEGVDHVLFHSPYNKLVQKSFARMVFADVRRLHKAGKPLDKAKEDALSKWLDTPEEETYADRGLESALKNLDKEVYASKVEHGCRLSKQIGNTYTASVFANIVCLVDAHGEGLIGQTALVFSYGSGAIATMYELEFREPSPPTSSSSPAQHFTLARMATVVNLTPRLEDREQLPPDELSLALAARAAAHGSSTGGKSEFVGYAPTYPVERLFPGAYYLDGVGADRTRKYVRRPGGAPRIRGGALGPELVGGGGVVEEEEVEGEGTGTTTDESESREGEGASGRMGSSKVGGTVLLPPSAPGQAPEKSGEVGIPPSPTTLESGAVESRQLPRVVVTGVACGLPGQRKVFEPDNLSRLLGGQNCLEPLGAATVAALVEKNVVQVKRGANGQPPLRVPICKASQTIKLAARLGSLDLTEYGVTPSIAATMDKAVKVAVVAGLEALRDAGIVTGEGESGWVLPGHMRDTTGVMYASSFPALDAAIGEVMRFLRSRCITRAKRSQLVAALRERLRAVSPSGEVSTEDEEALLGLEKAMVTRSTMNLQAMVSDKEVERQGEGEGEGEAPLRYEFDRKFLFRVLVLGNAQLAQMVGARGPNMQTNAACAGSTLAVAMAQDMLQIGRCERMVVIAGDDASGDALIPWLGNGFRALGAASTVAVVSDAALPFDARRNGMLLGAGGIGMVLETEGAAARRHCEAVGLRAGEPTAIRASGAMKARLLETQISNSAYHGASMDKHHIALELERFLAAIERNWGITRGQIAKEGVYFSHETCTHATPTASCSFNEVTALRQCFGDELLSELVIINTKGFTGHPMGVSFEDVAAVEVLVRGVVPPTANNAQPDPKLGNLRLSCGGKYSAKYALRFAAGFGSQVAFALYATVNAVAARQ